MTDTTTSADGDILFCQHSNELTFSSLQTVSRVYIIPFICIFGIISNTINIIVFTNKKMRKQLVNWFLLALALNDLLLFVATFFVFSAPVIAEHSEDIRLVNLSPPLLVFFYPIAHISHTCTVYLTILVSVHRCMGICHPFLVRRTTDARAVKIALLVLILFSVAFNVPRFFELQSVACQSEIFQCASQMVQPTSFMLNQRVAIVYRIVLYMIVMFLFPFANLTYVNYKIVRKLRLATVLRVRMSKPFVQKHVLAADHNDQLRNMVVYENLHQAIQQTTIHADKKEDSITIMLVLIVCQFLVYNSLAFANNILEQISPSDAGSFHFQLLVELSTIFANLNGATTIAYYLILGSKYKKVLKQMFNANNSTQQISLKSH